jgi:hypothetical protein
MLPAPGARVGSVCGPGERPEDTAGSVLCHVTDRWGTHAVVMMDSGQVRTVERLTKVGIGVYLISGRVVPAGYTDEYEASASGSAISLRILVKPQTDFDGVIRAWLLDSSEFLDLKGWLFDFEPIDKPDPE